MSIKLGYRKIVLYLQNSMCDNILWYIIVHYYVIDKKYSTFTFKTGKVNHQMIIFFRNLSYQRAERTIVCNISFSLQFNPTKKKKMAPGWWFTNDSPASLSLSLILCSPPVKLFDKPRKIGILFLPNVGPLR